MGKIPYMPFYPQDWLSDRNVSTYSLEERGAYIDLLCRLWENGGTLPDDDTFLAKLLRISARKWKLLRNVLLDGPFAALETDGQVIWQKRLLDEWAKVASVRQSRAAAGRQGGLAKAGKRLANAKHTASTSHAVAMANRKQNLAISDPDPESDSESDPRNQESSDDDSPSQDSRDLDAGARDPSSSSSSTLAKAWSRYMGGTLTPVFLDHLEDYLAHPTDPLAMEVVIDAMREAHLARAPTWKYLDGILRRRQAAGLATMDAVRAHEDRRKNGRARDAPAPPAGLDPEYLRAIQPVVEKMHARKETDP